MKIQIDQNNYLTGNYAMVGNLDNSIDMPSLPDSDPIFYSAYKILSKVIEEKVIVNESVLKHGEISVPILDDEGNDTGEVKTITGDYYEVEPVEKIIPRIECYYELDDSRKNEIDDLIKKLPSGDDSKPITITEVSDRVTNVQVALCELYERLELS